MIRYSQPLVTQRIRAFPVSRAPRMLARAQNGKF
jgi:hypothetical protein